MIAVIDLKEIMNDVLLVSRLNFFQVFSYFIIAVPMMVNLLHFFIFPTRTNALKNTKSIVGKINENPYVWGIMWK